MDVRYERVSSNPRVFQSTAESQHQHQGCKVDHASVQLEEAALDFSAAVAAISDTFLRVQGTTVAMDTPLMAAGLDSIATAEMASVLAQQFHVDLPQTALFDHPTSGAVASFIVVSAD